MKPQPSPGGLRSPRKRALEIGTSSSGFPDNAAGPYDATAGVPSKIAGGTYDDRVTGAPDPGPLASPSPFKVG